MSILSALPMVLEENADGVAFPSINTIAPVVTFTYLQNGTSPFDLTGYTASMMVRITANDSLPVATYSPALGGTAGTIAIGFTSAQTSSLLALLPSFVGIYDVLLTSAIGVKTHFIPNSPLLILRSVTR